MKVASLRTDGPFAWRVVEHRVVQGPQRWRIRLQTERADGVIDVQHISVAEPVPVRALLPVAQAALAEACAPGARIERALLSFHLAGRA